MKIVAVIARILLGLIFFVFGLNGFLHFIPAPPIPGLAGTFIGVLVSSHYVLFISGVQVIAGALLLMNRVCAPGTGAAGACHRKHPGISSDDAAKWSAAGNFGGNSLDHSCVEAAWIFHAFAGAEGSRRIILSPTEGAYYAIESISLFQRQLRSGVQVL